MRTIELNPISFIASPIERKFIVLRSEEADQNQAYLKEFATEKIKNREQAHRIKGVWGTLGYKSDKSIDWKGEIRCSNMGNMTFEKGSVVSQEIEYLKYMYPGFDETTDVIEKVIDFSDLHIDMPLVFDLDEIPELRLDVFLEENQGALAFYQYKRNSFSDDDIEFIQPQSTENNRTTRDRLTYNFNLLPRMRIEASSEVPGKYCLSGETSDLEFVVKVLVFQRKFPTEFLPSDSLEIIHHLESQLELQSNNFLAKKHKLLIFNTADCEFQKVNKPGMVDNKKKTLMLLHGTFSSTKGSFGDVFVWIQSLLNQGVYQQVLAFDHPTIFDDAEENVLALYKLFAEYEIRRFTKDIDLLGSSQGGLIAQYMANLKLTLMPIGKVILVASANGVGYLSMAKGMAKGLKVMRKIFRKTGMGQAALVSALLQHSFEWVISQKGMDLMRPGSKALNKIMYNTPLNPKTRYWPVVGNYSSIKPIGGVLENAVDLILGEDNDWVVNTKNQFTVPSNYCAISDYSPAKYHKYAVCGDSALHGKLITDVKVQHEITNFLKNDNYLQLGSEESKNTDLFDAHCHLFSRNIITGRVLLMLLGDLLSYFDKDDEHELLEPIDLREEKGGGSSFGELLSNILKYIVLNKNASEMFDDLERDYRKNNVEIYRYVPLMFDLEMSFRNTYNSDDIGGNLQSVSQSFKGEHKRLINKIEHIIRMSDKGVVVFKGTEQQQQKSIATLKKIIGMLKKMVSLSDNLSHDVGRAFNLQIEELQQLKHSYGNNIFPFLAVDPRRENMGQCIAENVGKGRVFAGIKLYAPNGYSPTDPKFFTSTESFVCGTSMFKWCCDFDIPIIAHNSDAGFATFADRLQVNGDICTGKKSSNGRYILQRKTMEYVDFNYNLLKGGFGKATKERAHTLNHPEIWRKVLKQYPNLRLCLAHFGGGNQDWQNEIAQLILEHDNVYTDLSCQTHSSRLQEIYDAYYKKDTADNLKIRSRIMYGSDYALNLLQGANSTDYYANFRAIFSDKDIEDMSLHVPKNFLNLGSDYLNMPKNLRGSLEALKG